MSRETVGIVVLIGALMLVGVVASMPDELLPAMYRRVLITLLLVVGWVGKIYANQIDNIFKEIYRRYRK